MAKGASDINHHGCSVYFISDIDGIWKVKKELYIVI